MSNNSADVLLCSYIQKKRSATSSGGDRNNIFLKNPIPHSSRHCQSCAWKEEQQRLAKRLGQQTRLKKLGQKLLDGFLSSPSGTRAHPNIPVLILFLAVLTGGLSVVADGSSPGNGEPPSSDVVESSYVSTWLAFVSKLLGIVLLGMLAFNTTKAKIKRYSQLQKGCRQLQKGCRIQNFPHENQSRDKKYAEILSNAIKFKTISYGGMDFHKNENRDAELARLHIFLQNSFEDVYRQYPPTVINQYSLLFKIRGQDETKKPILLCSHLDVVPAPMNNEFPWIRDPFSGDIIDGMIHGRGAIDNKHNVVSQLGAINEILCAGKLPKRTVYIALGHDEEIGGNEGAAKIAQHLKEEEGMSEGIEFILDEGTMMISGAIPGINEPVAIVGCVEKGHISVELTVKGPGGHSSTPPIDEDNPLKIMSKAIVALESNPVPAHFEKGSAFRNTLEDIAGELSFPLNVLCSNFWLFGPIFKHILLRANSGAAASIRTTTCVTIMSGGEKLNVIPSDVKAYINHRVHPADTFDDILLHNSRVINDRRVKIRLMDEAGFVVPPSPISDFKSKSFDLIRSTVNKNFGFGTVPGVMVGNTDTRWYWDLSKQIYRFSPVELTIQETKMFHGVNEKISAKALTSMIDFYKD
eukprot:CAMPEP_0194102584 /NCGR_PEP_ID=MMETSP0150-20130528/3185_1 /TAXON_ID=122233 /ORGANISM="Chaetoceros debilis, Strain MM31A-1" /LENGTH=636 /DNA_ID=CAMNT_0038789599 /DNA_START=88 /DNA_END=1995 /DNA_ORIENTATION=+